MLRLPVFLALFLVVRGAPVLLLYRAGGTEAGLAAAILTSATALPLVVAVTQIGLDEGPHAARERCCAGGGGDGLGARLPMVALQLRGRLVARVPASAAQEGF